MNLMKQHTTINHCNKDYRVFLKWMEYLAPWKSKKGRMYIFSWENTSKIPQGEQENWEKIDSKSVGWG